MADSALAQQISVGHDTLVALISAYASRTPVSTIAVVGNAPLQPNDLRAATIDDSDVVVRVNGFRIDEDGAPCAGKRTDVVVFTRGSPVTPWVFNNYRQRLYLLVEPGRMHWEPESWPDWWPEDLGYVPVPNRSIIVPLANRLGLRMRDEARWATTGTIAVWLAYLLFPEAQIKIAGYSFLEDSTQTAWDHAHGEPSAISREHALAAEAALLKSWADSGRLQILT